MKNKPLCRLIVDGGATTVKWSCLNEDRIFRGQTNGLNLTYCSDEQLIISTRSWISQVKQQCRFLENLRIFFHGAGLGSFSAGEKVKHGLQVACEMENVQLDSIDIHSDLDGAGKALFGQKGTGYAAILGTGSNIGYVREGKIEDTVPSLGYMLGDEGSGTYLGKCLITAYLRNRLPRELHENMENTFLLTPQKVKNAVYQSPCPHTFFSNFAPFLEKKMQHPFVIQLCANAFHDFFEQQILPLARPDRLPNIAFSGSVAMHFADILTKVLEQHGFEVTEIIPNPMQRLEEYYGKY
ncbi:MAG: hypothetical protein LBR51_06200 [Bacteroidales bacterium]|jgi:N-acetylglucosamine kinase-like BadF-type ATPase|nr:hypothetical protein [Bacteroidales bacterium]